ncbi:uncharacterized protein EV154DRAFT_39183 [Mucor mucedo]|uniref:uncharacterized protein n=1 Tax=Mucor mucedo TaxID=29922 RepID=UPI00221F7FFA|nr:uncharacterized protein EV154DRAFT_39183 [Mucor mucedo]KAI7895278.1 hypothetical protein EV154DRAFT_39183 [Mucor mucedo]
MTSADFFLYNSYSERLADVLNNHGQINVHPKFAVFNSKSLGKRRADEIDDGNCALVCIYVINSLNIYSLSSLM